MQNIITNAQIFDLIPGKDFEFIREYTLDEDVTITDATLVIKTQIETPDSTPTGPGTLIPVSITINDTVGSNGIISDTGAESGVCSVTFLLSGAITKAALDSDTMYFFGVNLETDDDIPQNYQPESGVIVTGSRML